MLINNKLDKKIVAYFDFDGTVTTKDTLVPFLFYVAGTWKFMLNLPYLTMVLAQYRLNIITNEQAKERALTILLKGYTFEYIDKLANSFVHNSLRKYIKAEIFHKIEYHKEHGHKVILISANLGIYLRHWVKQYHVDGVISTEIQFINNIATGKLATENCYGKQKVLRLKQYLLSTKQKFDYSYGYGDSRGDYDLLDYVDEGYLINGVDFKSWKGRKSCYDLPSDYI